MAMDVIAETMIQILFLLQPWNAMHLVPAIQIEFVVVHGDSQYMDLIDENKSALKWSYEINKINLRSIFFKFQSIKKSCSILP